MSCPYVPSDNLLAVSGFAFGAAYIGLTKEASDGLGNTVPAILEQPLWTTMEATAYGTCTAVGTLFVTGGMPSSCKKAMPVVLALSVCWFGYKMLRKRWQS